jgi:hypothetical protein
MLRIFVSMFIVVVVFVSSTEAREPLNPDGTADMTVSNVTQLDHTKYIDGNSILMFVTNHGSFGRDLSGRFGYDYGTFFPYRGTASILDGSLTMSPLYSAGLWIGGRVGNETRIAIAEYSDEFVPGPMVGGTYQNDRPEFRVYKLYEDSLAGNPNSDYLNWPVDQGAPVDSLGLPLMRGQQMLWTVYNDANPQRHDNDAGETDPLGIEVQQTTWTDDGGYSVPLAFFAPVSIAQLGASETVVTVEIVSREALTGHEYKVATDSNDVVGRYWRLTDLTTSSTILDFQTTLAEDNMIVTDGFIVQVLDPPSGFRSFLVVANANGVLDPPEAGAFDFDGFPVPTDSAGRPLRPTENQQVGDGLWGFHTADNGGNCDGGTRGTFEAFVSRTTRDGTNDEFIGQYDYEMRFTGDNSNPGVGGSYAIEWFFDDHVIWVPFELWRTGIGTPDDPSDDVRLVPYIIDDAGAGFAGDNVYSLESWGCRLDTIAGTNMTRSGGDGEHSASGGDNDPWTDWVYWELPVDQTPGESGYFAAEAAMLGGTFDGSLIEHELMARTVLVNWNGHETVGDQFDSLTYPPVFTQSVPEQGTVFRIETAKTIPADSFVFMPSATATVDTVVSTEALAIYTSYKMINKGNNVIDSCFVAIWSDPDLGGAGDDMVGCAPDEDIMYCYNGDADDERYRGRPPAIGFKLISGPTVPDPGKTAIVDGQVYFDKSEVGIYSFNKYINGTDPDNFEETYCYMQGLTQECTPYLYNGSPTRFVNAGDPVTGFGDIDAAPADKRMMGSYGPFTFNPGDTQTIVVKMAVAPGPDRLSSITLLREILSYDPTVPMIAQTVPGQDPILPVPKWPIYFYLGNLEGGLPVNDIDQESIRLNGTLAPDSVTVVSGVSGFAGDVLKVWYRSPNVQMQYIGSDFSQPLEYTFSFAAGQPRGFVATGQLSFLEIIVGDLNGDGKVNLTDVTALVKYLFLGGTELQNLAAADIYCDGAGQISLTDLTALINFLFNNGPPPQSCDYWLSR